MNQSFLNDDDQQQSSSSSSLTSNFDREMMQSLNLSANRYDPSLFQYYQSQSRSNNSNDDLDKNQMINMAGMKFKGRTQVYAGSSKVVTVPEVYRLQDICIKVLMNHVNKIYEVGDLPYFILKPVFAKCTVQQLRRIEHYNPVSIVNFVYFCFKIFILFTTTNSNYWKIQMNCGVNFVKKNSKTNEWITIDLNHGVIFMAILLMNVNRN